MHVLELLMKSLLELIHVFLRLHIVFNLLPNGVLKIIQQIFIKSINNIVYYCLLPLKYHFSCIWSTKSIGSLESFSVVSVMNKFIRDDLNHMFHFSILRFVFTHVSGNLLLKLMVVKFFLLIL